jgi:hypothetical protein
VQVDQDTKKSGRADVFNEISINLEFCAVLKVV